MKDLKRPKKRVVRKSLKGRKNQMSEMNNADRVALLAAREAKSPTPIERQYLDSAERLRLDAIDSASANLQSAIRRLGRMEAHH